MLHYICVTKANNMTLLEIKPKLTFLTGNTWNHQYKNVIVSGNKLKIDGIYGHIEVIDGIAYAVKNAPSKGFYESKSNYESRSEQWMNEFTTIDVIARYVNIMLKK